MSFSDDWSDAPTEIIERNPRLIPTRSVEELTYFPPARGLYDNDRPTFTELAAIGDAQ